MRRLVRTGEQIKFGINHTHFMSSSIHLETARKQFTSVSRDAEGAPPEHVLGGMQADHYQIFEWRVVHREGVAYWLAVRPVARLEGTVNREASSVR